MSINYNKRIFRKKIGEKIAKINRLISTSDTVLDAVKVGDLEEVSDKTLIVMV